MRELDLGRARYLNTTPGVKKMICIEKLSKLETPLKIVFSVDPVTGVGDAYEVHNFDDNYEAISTHILKVAIETGKTPIVIYGASFGIYVVDSAVFSSLGDLIARVNQVQSTLI
jgi:hypothetical protein